MTPICRRRGLSVLLVDRPIELALRLRSGLSDDPASTRSSLGGGRCGTARTRAQLFEPCPIAQTVIDHLNPYFLERSPAAVPAR